jgi:DNA repair protein RecN (Recombination protein N)
MRDREHRLDLLRFQVNEIESVNPQSGEMEELETSVSRLKHAEKLSTSTLGVLEAVADQENCAFDLLGGAIKSLEDCVRFDTTLGAIIVPLKDALYQIEDGVHQLRMYAENLDADPDRLEEVATRIDALKRLRRKYGEDEGAIQEYLQKIQMELALLEDSESSEEGMIAEVKRLEDELLKLSSRLSALRQERANEFSQLVQDQLRDLAMERAQFSVDFKVKPADANGMDWVEFYFSANAGEPPRPLSKIASGGEISRVMLAIKTALAGRAGVPTLIFDEVDSGVGGAVAQTVGRLMKKLGHDRQVLAVTHLPQVASCADHHWVVSKEPSSSGTLSQMKCVTDEERVSEIARMLGGEVLSQTTLAHAREMLAQMGTDEPEATQTGEPSRKVSPKKRGNP